MARWWIGFVLVARVLAAPNFVVFLSDDQDAQLNSLAYMQGVQTHLVQQGTTFGQHYCTVSICCPSRVNMWTGKAAHNTNVTDLVPPYGGYPKFIQENWHTKWLFTWLQKAGYKTYFTGKLMNNLNLDNYQNGLGDMSLDGHDFMIDPGTYQYFNTTFQTDDLAPQNYPDLYATDLLANKTLDRLEFAAAQDAPFIIAVNPVNPHGALVNYTSGQFGPPQPAPRYAGLFQGDIVPRNPNFNPKVPSGASWVRTLPLLKQPQVGALDSQFRARLQAIQAIDDMLNRTVDRLDSLGILDNTFVIYTSDNGFHMGQHRLTAGKRCPYEEDVRVPLVIRGPGVPKAVTANYVTSHTDITPSIVYWAGAMSEVPSDFGAFDGSPIPVPGVTAPNDTRAHFEHAQMEFWGQAKDFQDASVPPVNGYKSLRVIGASYNLYYAVWCDGSHELYDMTADPYQMNNLYQSPGKLLNTTIPKLRARLDALVLVLKTCSGTVCQDPWFSLHPGGAVHTLQDALNPKFDAFYLNQNKVHFSECTPGYFIDNERPLIYKPFGGGKSAREIEADWERFEVVG